MWKEPPPFPSVTDIDRLFDQMRELREWLIEMKEVTEGETTCECEHLKQVLPEMVTRDMHYRQPLDTHMGNLQRGGSVRHVYDQILRNYGEAWDHPDVIMLRHNLVVQAWMFFSMAYMQPEHREAALVKNRNAFISQTINPGMMPMMPVVGIMAEKLREMFGGQKPTENDKDEEDSDEDEDDEPVWQ